MPLSTHTDTYKGENLTIFQALDKKSGKKLLTKGIFSKVAKFDKDRPGQWLRILECASEIQIKENKLQTWYCENRFCPVCNKIKTATNINRYKEQITAIENKLFLTLTVPNCEGDNINFTIRRMVRHFQLIKKRIKKRYNIKNFDYIRKIETTINHEKNNFHPHFHFIVNDIFVETNKTERTRTSANISSIIIKEWLKDFPNAEFEAQKGKKADNDTIHELFKYFTKVVYRNKKGDIKLPSPKQYLQLRNGIDGVRTFQTGGNIQIPEHLKAKYLHLNPTSIIYKDIDKLDGMNLQYNYRINGYVERETGEIITTKAISNNLRKILKFNNYNLYEEYKIKDKKYLKFEDLQPEHNFLNKTEQHEQSFYKDQDAGEINAQCINKLIRTFVKTKKEFHYSIKKFNFGERKEKPTAEQIVARFEIMNDRFEYHNKIANK